MSTGAKGIRILLVGDDGVGKTSLILSLVTEEFPEEVPSRAEEITIPADVTPEKVPTHIVDFSYSEQTEDELRHELHLADVVCVVYAINDELCIKRITSYWLPIVFDVCGDRRKPVVLVGNKSDLAELEGSRMNDVLAIMDEYPEVETCIECSASDLKNISELFYYAQKAVLHPTAPIYSHDEQRITEKCEKGLIRIFKICDLDNDGFLNDVELNEFQKRCFKNSLPQQGLQEVKNIIKKNMKEGVTDIGVTLEGFLFLHNLFIQKGRQETTWTALRRFGYDMDLELRDDYLNPSLEIDPGCSLELSSAGLDFVMELFFKYDKDEDDALSPEELEDMLSLCDEKPWKDIDLTATCQNDKGWMTAEGFVAQWILWTYIDYSRTLKLFGYYGYIQGDMENQLTGLRITRPKDIDIQKRKTTRTVFLVYVVGAKNCGKTAFLQSFLNNTKANSKEIEFSKFACNSVQINKQEVHMILEEVDLENAAEKILSGKQDSVCFLFDVSESQSFSTIAKLHKSVSAKGCIFVGTKSDLSKAKQNFEVAPSEYAANNSSYELQFFSSNDSSKNHKTLFSKVATISAQLGGPSNTEKSLKKIIFTLGISFLMMAGVGFIAFRHIRKGHNLSNG